jgi:RHS repeat-associated protein
VYFKGRLLMSALGGYMSADRLGSVGTGSAYFPYGEEKGSPPTPTGVERFGTYYRDFVGQDYADQRYYNSMSGRFYTPDPGNAGDLKNPTSLNRYAYVLNDPINYTDPTGLDVSNIGIAPSLTPTCLNRFLSTVSGDLNKWLNSDEGTMALQVYWEDRGYGTQADQAIWEDIANVLRNRWYLTNPDKKRYGFTTAGFKQLIYETTGPQWNKSGTAAANASIWAPNGDLKEQYKDILIGILDGSPTSNDCTGMITAFQISDSVYNTPPHDDSGDPTNGALFFYYAGNNSVPTDPFGPMNFSLAPTALVPVPSSGGKSWIFYTPQERWSY